MEKTTVKDFIEKYDKRSSDALKDALIDSIKIKQYVPYITKKLCADTILEQCSKDASGHVHIDTPKRFMLHIQALLMMYTDIEIDPSHLIDDYDMLMSRGLLTRILEKIPNTELEEFEALEKMVFDDFMTNEYDVHSYLTKNLTAFYPKISDKLNLLLDALSNALNRVDEEKISKLLNKLQK